MEKRLALAAAALALAVIGLLPVLMIVASTFYEAGEFSLTAYRALLASSKQLAPLMGRSVLLSLSVTFLAMMVGTPLGVLIVPSNVSIERSARKRQATNRASSSEALSRRRRAYRSVTSAGNHWNGNHFS